MVRPESDGNQRTSLDIERIVRVSVGGLLALAFTAAIERFMRGFPRGKARALLQVQTARKAQGMW
jgi:hypothetical protein